MSRGEERLPLWLCAGGFLSGALLVTLRTPVFLPDERTALRILSFLPGAFLLLCGPCGSLIAAAGCVAGGGLVSSLAAGLAAGKSGIAAVKLLLFLGLSVPALFVSAYCCIRLSVGFLALLFSPLRRESAGVWMDCLFLLLVCMVISAAAFGAVR